jgi:hypothetical protein
MRLIGLAVVLAVSLVLAPLAAEAQQAEKVHRIGFLAPDSLATRKTFIDAFRQGLRDLGYGEGTNFVVEYDGLRERQNGSRA